MITMRSKDDRDLSIRNLNISFDTTSGTIHAIRGVRMDLFKGETIAIVGESGSGKSVTVKTIMGILASNGKIESGSIDYTYTDDDSKKKIKIGRRKRGRGNYNPVQRNFYQYLEFY